MESEFIEMRRTFSPSIRRHSIGLFALAAFALPLLTTEIRGQADTVMSIGTARNNVVGPTRAQPGEVAPVGFYYSDPSSNIQGFTIAVCYDDNLIGIPGSFTVSFFLSVIGAEFLNVQVDNLTNDGDGKELIIGILLDASPPFDGQTAPPSLNPIEIGTFQFLVPADTDCFTCLPVIFCNGINGNGQIPLSNIVVIDSESVQPEVLVAGEVCVPRHALFVRGDSNNDSFIDIADVIHILSFLFLDGATPQCLDAADMDNDGIMTITDPVFLTLYIFVDGIAPPSPFPDCGIEPSPDDDGLDCFEPTNLCPVCP